MPAAGICGPALSSAIRASTWAETAGSASVLPSGAATTTVALGRSKASPVPGKSSCCRVCACSDGMPGIENESIIGLEIEVATPPMVTSAMSQAAMKYGQRRKASRPSR